MNASVADSPRPDRPAGPLLALGLRWGSRLIAGMLALLWGAFFVEHVYEWFVTPANSWPPARVWVVVACHAFMLVGLVAILRWARAGSALCAAGTIAFYASMAPSRLQTAIVLTGLIPPALMLASLALATRTRR